MDQVLYKYRRKSVDRGGSRPRYSMGKDYFQHYDRMLIKMFFFFRFNEPLSQLNILGAAVNPTFPSL